MTQALVSVICPLALARIPDAEAAIDRLGNPARPDVQAALDRLDGDGLGGTHFASLHAVRSADGERGYILLEISADGAEQAALARIVAAMGEVLRPIILMASDWSDGGDLADYLGRHHVAVGGGWFDNPGVSFSGTPARTVGRIRMEARLTDAIVAILARQPGHMHALDRVADVRRQLGADPAFPGVLDPALLDPPFEEPSIVDVAGSLVVSFLQTYLWPAALLVLLWGVAMGVRATWITHGFWKTTGAFVVGAATGLWAAAWVALVAVLLLAGFGYAKLRDAEARDPLEERTVDAATNAAMFARENRYAQNHMISVTQRKPGLLRAFTLRLIFWAIGGLVKNLYRPGFLSDIGTIHFARWVTPPGSPDLVFLSNYDGSWESYLEDFITRAHTGLTGVWSNSIGFPRSENLVNEGATDGERFKRYARHSMQPTRFWYSAYPTLTTTAIRANTEVRRGLSGIMTEDEALRWLALFGSAPRPETKLVSSEIQSLVFGGLKFMPFGACLIIDLPEVTAQARAWLRSITSFIAFNDGRRLGQPAVVTLALGARGLQRLGLPADALAGFPFTFLEGMTTEARSRLLGDIGDNRPEAWRWGGRARPDAALLVYGTSPEAVEQLEEQLGRAAAAVGMAAPHRIPLKTIQHNKAEPFGFRDGISQPVIRGTYKGERYADPNHLVEAGEFILGYPDNRRNLPPGPTLRATDDPRALLPLTRRGDGFARTVVESDRDLGFNGSFLVIRELEQDVAGFWAYCQSERERLKEAERLSHPYPLADDDIGVEFIAAKLVGRWKDGSSLVRHPYEPGSKERAGRKHRHARTEHRHGEDRTEPAEGVETPQDKPLTHETIRATTAPSHGPAIERPLTPSRDDKQGDGGDNDFLFGTEDPEALRCPFGAHILRANPRDSLDPGSKDQIAISNRHRIMRVGRPYEPEPGNNPGLLFMCLNGDIERQFEFLQQTWLQSATFHGLSQEKDPLLGDGEGGATGFTIPSRDGPVRLAPMPRFVTTRGGGYFFLPGKRLIDYLSDAP